MQVAMQQSATDPTTGTIDMDSILTGMSAADRQAQSHLSTEILVLLKSKDPHCKLHETLFAVLLCDTLLTACALDLPNASAINKKADFCVHMCAPNACRSYQKVC